MENGERMGGETIVKGWGLSWICPGFVPIFPKILEDGYFLGMWMLSCICPRDILICPQLSPNFLKLTSI